MMTCTYLREKCDATAMDERVNSAATQQYLHSKTFLTGRIKVVSAQEQSNYSMYIY